eukprot:5994877-Pyramimonas_sp.AAC.1
MVPQPPYVMSLLGNAARRAWSDLVLYARMTGGDQFKHRASPYLFNDRRRPATCDANTVKYLFQSCIVWLDGGLMLVG